MNLPATSPVCLSCGRSDKETPLVTLRYADAETWICPECLPVLIHHQERLSEKLARLKESAAHKDQKG